MGISEVLELGDGLVDAAGVPTDDPVDEPGRLVEVIRVWQHPDLLPDADDLDDPAGFIDRVIGGDTSGIDEAIAKLEQDPGPEDPGSDGGAVDN